MKVYNFTLSVTQDQYVSWTAFNIVAVSLEARVRSRSYYLVFYSSRLKCNSKVCLQVHFCFIKISLPEKITITKIYKSLI